MLLTHFAPVPNLFNEIAKLVMNEGKFDHRMKRDISSGQVRLVKRNASCDGVRRSSVQNLNGVCPVP